MRGERLENAVDRRVVVGAGIDYGVEDGYAWGFVNVGSVTERGDVVARTVREDGEVGLGWARLEDFGRW